MVLLLWAGSVASAEQSAKDVPHFYTNPHSGFRLPRPSDGATDIPLAASIYFVLTRGAIDAKKIEVKLNDRATDIPVLLPGEKFADGFTGKLRPVSFFSEKGVGVYIKPQALLRPSTKYTVSISGPVVHHWSFTTTPEDFSKEVAWSLDLSKTLIVRWDGQLWSGVLRPSFNTTDAYHQNDSHRMMREVREKSASPVWSLFRPWPMTGDFYAAGFFDGNPNLVRERETRRITQVEDAVADGATCTRLRVTDTFEHKLFGIEDNRPLSQDYHPGDKVLIADKEKSETTEILSVNDDTKDVMVKHLSTPSASWILDYPGATPRANPVIPGHFTHPLCYLRKFSPVGTPLYFWGRLDQELDRLVKDAGFRVVVNFVDTPCDLSIDGVPCHGGNGSPNKPKDYVEYWNFVYEVTSHIVKRYGPAAQYFYYSVGNEFDLRGLFWRGSYEEMLEYYDYTADAMLRAIEDNGLDSSKVRVGGMEWALIWGSFKGHQMFAQHCTPKGGQPNYAWKDPRLNGRHSKRVAEICEANKGNGSPCNFFSVHCYCRSDEMARRMLDAKRMALEVDPERFKDAYVDVHESCPDWIPNGDPAQWDAYVASGFFPAWCVDVMQRLLEKGSADSRYAHGETILTIWPMSRGTGGLNNMTTLFDVGGGKWVTVPYPIFHFHTLLGKMSHEYFPLEAKEIGGARIAGFGSRDKDAARFMIYAIHPEDTETAGGYEYRVRMRLSGLAGGESKVTEWRIDRQHASMYPELKKLKKTGEPSEKFTPQEVKEIEQAAKSLIPTSRTVSHMNGALALDFTVSENGVTMIEVAKKE